MKTQTAASSMETQEKPDSNQKKIKLCIECGKEPVLARGLGSKCYNKHWRENRFNNAWTAVECEIDSLINKKKWMERCYAVCVGLEQRIKWRREIEEIELKIKELEGE